MAAASCATGAGIVAVPDSQLLFAMGRADARIHVEHDGLAAVGEHGRDRSIGRKDRQQQKGSLQQRASASRSGPFGWAMPQTAIVMGIAAVGVGGAWYLWQQQKLALPAGIAKANGRFSFEPKER
jgi:hypothetical protein